MSESVLEWGDDHHIDMCGCRVSKYSTAMSTRLMDIGNPPLEALRTA